ncbi:hypothetical protein J3458_004249 [Metarhizium acridum]|uniref:uncharacterized protein n=1 Tax=Metarhizium acridum TaxID=92637 RepID=UPI001C6D2749|nr:hypothetical protein J3458_004249 [Metarhizium acridum]
MPRSGADVRCLAALPASSLVLPPVLRGSPASATDNTQLTARLLLPPPATSFPSLPLLRTSYSSTPFKPIQLPTSASPLPSCISTAPFRRSILHQFAINLTSHG